MVNGYVYKGDSGGEVCKANGLKCEFHGDCCSKYCDQGTKKCSQEPVDPDCRKGGATCATDDECCDKNCVNGVCKSRSPIPNPNVPPPTKESSQWPWMLFGLALIGAAIGVTLYAGKTATYANPTRKLSYEARSLLGHMSTLVRSGEDVNPWKLGFARSAANELYYAGYIEPITASHWMITDAGMGALAVA